MNRLRKLLLTTLLEECLNKIYKVSLTTGEDDNISKLYANIREVIKLIREEP